ncbi:MAG: hypothetical protein ACKV1O_05990 [Saprospiraceae bacterium]
MNNVLFGPTPKPDAFSTTYNYDEAGNIQQLTRRGLIGTGAINTLQSDIIDQLTRMRAAAGCPLYWRAWKM